MSWINLIVTYIPGILQASKKMTTVAVQIDDIKPNPGLSESVSDTEERSAKMYWSRDVGW